MPSVPTATITHSNPRPLSINGQAKPCTAEPARHIFDGFPQGYPPQKPVFRPESLTQAHKSKPADRDIPISAVRLTPRLG